MSNPQALVQKLWNYCNILRDDGLSYGDYVEQLTFLLFLKMADEQEKPPFNKPSRIPKGFGWNALLKLDGDDLEIHYRHTLEELGKRSGMLGVIFRKAQNKIQDPAKLRRLIVDLIDKEQWSSLSADVKGDAYEGLLQKNAEDVKGGAGEYFTPRPLIAAMVSSSTANPPRKKPWTQKLWIYDLRTNLHFTLKENTLKRSDLDDFVNCYFGGTSAVSSEKKAGTEASPPGKNRHDRKESERFKSITYQDLIKRDKINLDIFWLKDEALEDSANLPAPELIAAEIVEDLEAALSQFAAIASDLNRH